MAQTNFKIFNEEMNSDRTFSDSEYEVATQRQGGVIPGMALSRLHNKLYRQSTAMAKAIADFLVAQGYDCIDNDVPGITTAIEAAILKAASEGIGQHKNALILDHPDNSVTDAKIGQRAINDTTAAVAGANTLTALLSMLAYMVKETTGKADWYTTPVKTIEQLNTEKAPIASPALSGTPTAPTAAAGTNTTQIATTAFVQAAVAALIASAPGTLDTLNELAAALGDDPNFATTVTNAIAAKLAASEVVTTATANKVLRLNASGQLPASITGNAASAAKLATTRKISGVSFDGSSDITIPYSGLSGLPAIPANPNDYIIAQSLGLNGWRKWASGLIEQWGYATVAATDSWLTGTLTYPIAFPSTVYNLQVSPVMRDDTFYFRISDVTSKTTASIRVYSATAGTYGYYWRAIGV